MRDADGPPPTRPAAKGSPVPWLLIRERIAEDWRMAPWEIPDRDDWEHPLADEVGRWVEVAALKARYPAY